MTCRLFDGHIFMALRNKKPPIFIYVHAEVFTKKILYLSKGFF